MPYFVRFTFALIFAAFLALGAARADVPGTLNYQGTLTDNTGQPVNGSKTITFRLYDVPTGGTAFWTETQTINLVNGRLSVVLGGNAGNPIDPKKFTGETYVGIQVAPDTEMSRQKFTSVAYAFKAADAIPKGVIVMWSGTAADIPAGWALCDGTNGTPNLRDRFIVGAGTSYGVGVTGGEATHLLTVNELPSHSHPLTDPGHTHGYKKPNMAGLWVTYKGTADSVRVDPLEPQPTNSAQTGITIGSTGNGNAHENRPPYYALAFIMKL